MSIEPRSESSVPSGDAKWTTRRLLDWIRGFLETNEVDSPRVCAELLLGHVLGCERLRLYMDPDRVVPDEDLSRLRGLVERASRHEPVQYLVGAWPFHGREFEVSPCTLIPRPCTEGLVELALDEVKSRGVSQDWRILDLCTGSGCIAVSLAASIRGLRAGPVSERIARKPDLEEIPTPDVGEVVFDLERQLVSRDSSEPAEDEVDESQAVSDSDGQLDDVSKGGLLITATDVVREALELAGRNARRHGLDVELELRQGSLFEALPETDQGVFDIICANPPYVSAVEYEALDRNVREYEPRSALHGGVRGLDFVEPILRQSVRWLKPGGLLIMEFGANNVSEVQALAEAVPDVREFKIVRDHEQFPRFLVVRFKSE